MHMEYGDVASAAGARERKRRRRASAGGAQKAVRRVKSLVPLRYRFVYASSPQDDSATWGNADSFRDAGTPRMRIVSIVEARSALSASRPNITIPAAYAATTAMPGIATACARRRYRAIRSDGCSIRNRARRPHACARSPARKARARRSNRRSSGSERVPYAIDPCGEPVLTGAARSTCRSSRFARGNHAMFAMARATMSPRARTPTQATTDMTCHRRRRVVPVNLILRNAAPSRPPYETPRSGDNLRAHQLWAGVTHFGVAGGA